MKRFMVSLVLGLGALLCACTQQDPVALPAGLQGTYDLALVNDLVFVTSTDRNELRVLQLTEDVTKRGYVRAPNPLEPLAIPVLPRPQALARDVRYDAEGNERTGTYVYARSGGSSVISVVDSAVDKLREVARLDTRLMTGVSSGPVTAFASLATEQEGGSSTLYFATQEPAGARLWRAPLSTDPQALASPPAPLTAELILELAADESVNSLLVLPDPNLIAVSTHRGQFGHPGTSFILEVNTKVRRTTLDFGGAQVLQLVTHSRVPGEDAQPERRAAGARIFGVLDPSNCTQPAAPAPAATCPSGILAVDSTTGTLAKDFTGYPMLPINSGPGLSMGLSLSTNTLLSVQGGEKREATVPLLGIVPLSTGGILFFDALNLVHLNVGAAWLATETPNTATAAVSLLDVVGNNVDPSTPDRRADIAFSGTFGVTRDEAYVLTSEGVLPNASRLERDPATPTFTVPIVDALEDGVARPSVRPGDLIVLLPEDTSLPACAESVLVGEVQRAPAAPTALLVPAGALPAACADYPRFAVRAGGERSLVLTDAAGNYLQRMGTGSTYSRADTFFFHPPGYAGQATGTAVSLTVTRDLRQSPVGRDQRFVVTTASHFFPYLLTVDLVNYDALRFFRLPGPVVRARVGNTDFAYIVYPSANAILQMNLSTVVAGAANALALATFR
ncbi:hypothetical protein D187_008385 [Cystobacter fuscus DSM 2262]|uniref:Lipoprotein n=1 Tax=Cystobacter fuscus (strain ATCC 25194 / DSM 2262 / NBRC 100088 / M29) TaxID=1242864 RepID=S9Q3C6_CYSF2|nr:hypothetical protein [Cystobacter fuscus]EPX55824.1 hypothetical protein D187_008385 [Cystobacter fuscus DSM 2262]